MQTAVVSLCFCHPLPTVTFPVFVWSAEDAPGSCRKRREGREGGQAGEEKRRRGGGREKRDWGGGGEGEREKKKRQTETETRQTETARQTDRQAGRQTDLQADRQTERDNRDKETKDRELGSKGRRRGEGQ